MRYFSKIGLNNKVKAIINVHENNLKDSNNVENENLGVQFLNETLGNGNYIQCWKDGSIRKNMAGIGFTYDEDRDAFIPPKPFNSWVLNETTCQWEAPIALPDTENRYNWNEINQNWDIIE
jgi:hypothetical protein|tara:strand:- start:142 stop:504 length:363 start_codon:yes stop_codon:yes gene_type:complete